MAKAAGNRNAKRIAAVYPVKMWGMDANGKPFIETATTVNVSRSGALLTDVPTKLKVGDVIGLKSGERKCRFRVMWIGQEDSPDAGHMGLQSVGTETPIWDLTLPSLSIDIYTRPPSHERRLISRLSCLVSAEVGMDYSAGRGRAFVTDLSLGGCYVSSSAPFPLEAKVTIGLWLDDRTRIWADGIVISHHSGLGMGVKFVNISHKNREDVMNFLDQLPKSEENPLLRDDE